MGKLIKQKYDFLKDLTKLSKKERDIYIKKCSCDFLHVICEAVHNIVRGSCKNKKSRRKSNLMVDLKKLSNARFDIEKKRKILLNQKGSGIFSLIASTVLPFLANLIFKKK